MIGGRLRGGDMAPFKKLFAPALVVMLLGQGGLAERRHAAVAAAVKNEVQSEVGGTTQALAAGMSLYQDQRVQTGADAMAQLLFLDQTSLSIGPKSEVRLDRFV